MKTKSQMNKWWAGLTKEQFKITLAALKESIAHWKRLANGKRQKGEEILSSDCALCQTFVVISDSCYGCPVMALTGESSCRKTPWRGACETWEDYGPDSIEFQRAAFVQLEFLKSLLP
jgi:hypothetical protein